MISSEPVLEPLDLPIDTMALATKEGAPKMRLYVLPWDLYPRRVTICLKEKAISDKFEVTPVEITRDDMSPPEDKPPGTVPIRDIGTESTFPVNCHPQIPPRQIPTSSRHAGYHI